jgi:hypothetical protein
LNVRPGAPYEGLANPSQRDGFCNFSSATWGFRAAFRNYITKFDRGVNTIRALITEWAPPGDNNNTEAYIKAVCDHVGYKPDDVIALKTWTISSAVCYAQAEVESGQPFEANWTLKQMQEGAFRAGITDAPPPVATKVLSTIASSGAGVAAAASAGQAAIESAQTNPHSGHTMIILGIAAAVLAFIGAILRAKTHTEPST